jgi:hypothetical protein
MTGVMQSMVGGSYGAPVVPLSMTFYENRFGATIGTIDVYVVDTSGVIQGSAIYSASGDLGVQTWFLRTPTSVGVSGTFRIAWHYVSGASFTGDYAVDTVTIQGTTYNFDAGTDGFLTTSGINTASSSTALSSAIAPPTATSASLGRWNRDTGTTPSAGTGPAGAQSGLYYLYAETSAPNFANINMWLFSPEITV